MTTPTPEGREELTLISVRKGQFSGSGDTSGYGGLLRPVTMPGPSPRPYGEWFDGAVDILTELLGDKASAAIESVVVDRGELTLHIARDHIVEVCQHLRDDQDLRFEVCLGVNGVHYPADKGRELHAVYPLMSFTHNRQLRLEVACGDDDPHIPSVCAVYPANNWHERETYDFFGIIFDGHPGLARIEMPDDWQGHPQRKDYPLGGIPVEYKGADHPAPRHEEAVPMTAFQTAAARPFVEDPDAPEYSAYGGDWSDIADEAARLGQQRIVVNMGPQHPSTHGVLRVMLEIEGETVKEARAGIGYLHTGIEKNMEFRTWTQGVTFATRMDYVAAMCNEAVFCLGGREAAGHHGRRSRARQRAARTDGGAHPHRLAPGRDRHRRQRDGRHHGDDDRFQWP